MEREEIFVNKELNMKTIYNFAYRDKNDEMQFLTTTDFNLIEQIAQNKKKEEVKNGKRRDFCKCGKFCQQKTK